MLSCLLDIHLLPLTFFAEYSVLFLQFLGILLKIKLEQFALLSICEHSHETINAKFLIHTIIFINRIITLVYITG